MSYVNNLHKYVPRVNIYSSTFNAVNMYSSTFNAVNIYFSTFNAVNMYFSKLFVHILVARLVTATRVLFPLYMLKIIPMLRTG